MAIFQFKQFQVHQSDEVFKITTDATLLGGLVGKGLENKKLNILEIGTGTGVVTLMLAQRFPLSIITAIDNNKAAVNLCRTNFEQSPFADRLTVIEGDVMDMETIDKYDMIVTNPPYFVEDTQSTNTVQKTARHQSSFGYSELISKMVSLAKKRALISIIHPSRYQNLVTSEHFVSEKKTILFQHDKKAVVRNMITELCIDKNHLTGGVEEGEILFPLRKIDGRYSDEYINAHKEFLIIF